MKHFFIIIIILFLLKGACSQDYYYYKGNKIELNRRSDKIAIVLNSSAGSEHLRSSLRKDVSNSDELKQTEANVFLLTFKEVKSSGELSGLISSLSSSNNQIKFVTPVYFGESRSVTQIPTDQFIVRLRKIEDKDKLEVLNIRYNVSIVQNVGDDKCFLLQSNYGVKANALELSNDYYSEGIFEYAEPNFLYPEFCILNSVPNDFYYPQQWAIKNTGQSVPTGGMTGGDVSDVNGLPDADMDVDLAWDFTTGSELIKIGVLDTGIDSTHPDFQSAPTGHLLPGYDAYYDKNSVPVDSFGHGTCTAGIIGAVMNNGIGVAGVAPLCRVMAIKIFNGAGTTNPVVISRAFDTAAVRDLDILCNSYNGGTPSQTVTNAISNSSMNGKSGKGCLIFFAGGNDGRSAPWFPSYLPDVVCVGASTPHDQKKSSGTGNQFVWGSNYGESSFGDLDVVAPTICYTTDVQGGPGYNHQGRPAGDYFSYFSGTSCSTPNVAGVAALILSVNIAQTKNEVLEKLFKGCEKIDNVSYNIDKQYGKWNEYYGYGRVNAYNSVRLAAGVDVTPPVITHKNISSAGSTYPFRIKAEIHDQDGLSVPDSGFYKPQLFYRTNKLNNGWSAFDSLCAKFVHNDFFTFEIPCQGFETQVQYYIKAYDNSGNYAFFPRSSENGYSYCYFAIGNLETESRTIQQFTASPAGLSYSGFVGFDSLVIVNSSIDIYLRHNIVSEEIITLCSPLSDPNNNRKCLFASNGGTGSDILGARVCDTSSHLWNNGTPPYSGECFKSDHPLNGLNGTNAFGDWRILNYDQWSGNPASYDSVVIHLTKTSGEPSSCISSNSLADSLINFGFVNYGDTVVKNFYIKNKGTSVLNITGVEFVGEYSDRYSLVDSIPGPVAVNDSGLFNVRLISTVHTGDSSGIENAHMVISSNDPSKPKYSVILETENQIPVPKFLNLHALIQGLYRDTGATMITDTIRVYLRGITSPFDIVDSAKAVIDSAGKASLVFLQPQNDFLYYVQLLHRNSIETWSSTGYMFVNDSLNFDITTSDSAAFGNNIVSLDSTGSRFGLYSGDVNAGGDIDMTDLIMIYNDAQSFVNGYVTTDVNGDNSVDVSDIIIAYNNAQLFITAIRP